MCNMEASKHSSETHDRLLSISKPPGCCSAAQLLGKTAVKIRCSMVCTTKLQFWEVCNALQRTQDPQHHGGKQCKQAEDHLC